MNSVMRDPPARRRLRRPVDRDAAGRTHYTVRIALNTALVIAGRSVYFRSRSAPPAPDRTALALSQALPLAQAFPVCGPAPGR